MENSKKHAVWLIVDYGDGTLLDQCCRLGFEQVESRLTLQEKINIVTRKDRSGADRLPV